MASTSWRVVSPLVAALLSLALAAGPSAQPAPPAQDHVLQFGGGDLAVAPPHAALDLGAAFTIEGWVYVTGREPYAFVLGKPHDPRHQDPYMSYALVFAEDGARLEFVQTTGAPGSYRAVGTRGELPLARWVHVAATLEGGRMRLFVDGRLEASGESAGTPSNATLPFGVGGGAQADGGVIGGFRGGLREVRVWDRALDEASLAGQMGTALTGQEAGLVAYWPLDDGEGAAARDLGPLGLPLQLGTAMGDDDADPTWIRDSILSGGPYFTARSFPLSASEANDVYVLDAEDPARQIVLVHQLRWPPTDPATELPLVAFQNDGTGRFTEATAATFDGAPPRTVHARAYAVADFTGDGRSDMYVADHGTDMPPYPGQPNLLLVRQPDGRLADEAPSRMSPIAPDFTHGLAVGDVTGDGRPDVLSINSTEWTGVPPLLYVNDGAGRFTAENDRLPPRLTRYERKYLSGEVVDVDRDGDGDLVLGGHNGVYPAEFFTYDAVLMNDGTGHFAEGPEATLPPRYGDASWGTVDVVSADVNADGWPDLLLATHNDYGSAGRYHTATQLLINRGDGTFAEGTDRLPAPPAGEGQWVIWNRPADFNGDGWTDVLVVVMGEGVRLYLNTGDGRFEDASFLLPGQLSAAAVADVDGDGDPDVVGIAAGGLHVFENVAPYRSAPSDVPFPAAPTLTGPTGGAQLPAAGSLTWERVPTASSYDVEVALDPGFTEVVLSRPGVTVERVRADLGSAEGPAYWRARARNSRGAGPWSEPAAFGATAVTRTEDGAAVGLGLEPPSPNPVGRVATVAFTTARSGDVRLDVVDALGRYVETLVAGAVEAGRHTAVWDASGRAPGAYFVRLQAQGASAVRPLLVAR